MERQKSEPYSEAVPLPEPGDIKIIATEAPPPSEQERLQAQFVSSMRDAITQKGDLFETEHEVAPKWFGMNRLTFILLAVFVALLVGLLGIKLVMSVAARANNDMERLRILEARLNLPMGATREEVDRGQCPGTFRLWEKHNCQRHVIESYAGNNKAITALEAVKQQGWSVEKVETSDGTTKYTLDNNADAICVEVSISEEDKSLAANRLVIYAPSDQVCLKQS